MEIVRQFASWTAVIFISLGGSAFLLELITMGRSGASLANVVASSLVSLSLSLLISFPVAVFAVLYRAIERVVARKNGWVRGAWYGVIFSAGFAVGWNILAPRERLAFGPYVIFCFLFGAAAFVISRIPTTERKTTAIAAALIVGTTGIAGELFIPQTSYPEFKDCFFLIAAAGFLSGAVHLRAEFTQVAHRLLGGFLVGIALGLGWLFSVDQLIPGWRISAVNQGGSTDRLCRFVRAAVDLDRDGFSPMAWGGDCDDFDRNRNPYAWEDPTGKADLNCNGSTRPLNPNVSDYGLTEAFGIPDVPSVNSVILISVDALRADVATPELMPNLTAIGKRGIRFARTYAAGAGTLNSVPLLHVPYVGAPPVAASLKAAGIGVQAIQSGRFFEPNAFGFSSIASTVGNDTNTTNQAVDLIRAWDLGRHFLWIHYFDVHHRKYPRDFDFSNAKLPQGLSDDALNYRRAAFHVDAEIGRLLEAVAEIRGLDRTAMIVIADHGEGLGEHGVFGHMRTAYDMVVRVPSVLIAPGLKPKTYAELTSLRDIPPTILGLFGLEKACIDAERFGRSWLRIREREDPLHRFVVVRSARKVSGRTAQFPMSVLVEGNLKLTYTYKDDVTALYDSCRDKAETEDFSLSDPKSVSRMKKALAVYQDLDGFPADYDGR